MILNLSVLKKSNSNYVFFLLVSLVAHSLLFFTLNLENSNYQPKEQYKEVKIILEPEAKNSNKKRIKAERPPISQLVEEVKKLGYCGTGRKYGVSDNAIRKWIKG